MPDALPAPDLWADHLAPDETLHWQGKSMEIRPMAFLPLILIGILILMTIDTLKDAASHVTDAIAALAVFAITIALLLFILRSIGFLPVHYALTDRRALRLATRRGKSDLLCVLRVGAYATTNRAYVFILAQNGKTMRFNMRSFKQSMWMLTQIGTVAPLSARESTTP